MISSSSTFCPHSGRVIRDLSRHLHAVWHGTEALVYSNHPTEAAASSYLAIIFGRLPVACLTLGLSRGMNGVTQRELSLLIVTLGTRRLEDSGAARNATEFLH